MYDSIETSLFIPSDFFFAYWGPTRCGPFDKNKASQVLRQSFMDELSLVQIKSKLEAEDL